MPEEKTAKGKSAAGKAPEADAEATDAAESEDDAPTYEQERLIRESYDFLGHPPHVAAGAFYGLRKKNLTLDEAKAAIDEWLVKPEEVA